MSNEIINHKLLPKVLEDMIFLRTFEEKASDAYRNGLIGGFCHLYIGQEAVVCGTYLAIDPTKDQVVTSYRDHAHILLAGTDPKSVMAELFGRSTGISKGKGGSMHLFDTQNRFYGGHGIVGAQVSIGTGIGFANKYQENGALCVTFFGDGACHQGQVYESFNMAKLWNLPVIYVLENNKYAMGTSVPRSSSVVDLYKRGESFGIPGVRVNGMDVFEVKRAMDAACKHVREGNGPMLLEVDTYRYRGHSMSDPAKYRERSEVDHYRETKDPLETLKQYILKNGILSDSDIKKLEDKAKSTMKDVIEFANNSPEPDLAELYTEVYPINS